MSNLVNSYTFNNLGRMGDDLTTKSQHAVHNTRFANHMLADFNSQTISDGHIKFSSQFPTMNVSGTVHGTGLNSAIIDNSSELSLNVVQDRPLEKLQLNPRPFLTVPYLGRGSVDPTLESQLLQGENSNEKKSISTIMEQSFSDLSTQPVTGKMKERVVNPKYNVEEAALDGWVRGGAATRELARNNKYSK
tara:strand:+ start:394 stop:966 length:573 start_codon:yes stop_codon:yes gene_type:complete